MAKRKTTKPAAERAPISQRQLEANRNNAQLSTGPRTEAGKAASSRNAWKHGRNSATAKVTFAQHGAQALAQLWGKPCQTTCPIHPDNPASGDRPCSIVLDGMTSAGGNCLDKTVFIHALSAVHDAIDAGEMTGVNAMLAMEAGKFMQLLHEMAQEIATKGLMTAVPMVTKDGDVVYDREGKMVIAEYRLNPMIAGYTKLLSDVGISLPEMLATPQARARAKTTEQTHDVFQTMMGRIMHGAGPLPAAAPVRPVLPHQPSED